MILFYSYVIKYCLLQMLNNAQGPQNYMINQGQNSAGIYFCFNIYLKQFLEILKVINTIFVGPYGSSNNYRSQQTNMQVPNDLVMKLMEAQQVNSYTSIFLFEVI